jgi:hypothetical protein
VETDVERANRIAERLLETNPKVAKIVADARLFDSLRTDPGWQRLFERVRAKEGKWMQSVLNRLMGPKRNWPEPTEIAYYQGFYQGAVFVLAHPEHAEANLERAARLAWIMSEEDDPTEEVE